MGDPLRFIEHRSRDRVWRVDATLASGLESLGWPEPAAVEAAFAGATGASGRAQTAILAVPGASQRVHLRPVRHGGLLGPLWRGAILGTARPEAELAANASLYAAGAPVPRPALVVAWRQRGPWWRAVVGTRHEDERIDGAAWLAAAPDRTRILRAARAIGVALRRFHDAGGRHADLHAKNLLLRERGDDLDVLVIDLDGARCGDPPAPARRMQELMRLVRGLHKRGFAERVGARGLAAGFGAYCAGDRPLRRAMLAHLPSEERRLARHRLLYGRPPSSAS